MDRRSFLSTISAFAVTVALDPERLLWRPGERKIFVPPGRRFEINMVTGVDIEYPNAELALTIDEFRICYIDPIIEVIHREVDAEMRFIYGSAWSSETISKREYRHQYPDSKLSS